MSRRTLSALAVISTLIAGSTTLAADEGAHDDELLPVAANDNRRPAGTLAGGSLVLKLRAGVGLWRPEGDTGPALAVEAFGEDPGPLRAPAPLIRVPEGTEIVASIRNDLDVTLRVHGLCARDGSPCAPVDVPATGRRDVRFVTGRAGTYHYWATTTGMPLPFRAAGDTQLSGAFIVDPPGADAEADRVLVITDWTSVTPLQLREVMRAADPGAAFLALDPRIAFLINGLSWPATERFTYQLDEQVRWRVVNLSSQLHPMHLHGFYFEVEGLGDGLRDAAFEGADRPRVVTQLLPPGGTMAMTWRAERTGNWLFHCHISYHISPERRLTGATGAEGAHHAAHDTSAGMAGMVLGVTIVDAHGAEKRMGEAEAIPARKLTLAIQAEPRRHDSGTAYGFVLVNGEDTPLAETVTVPGPTLALARGEPVEITLVNHLPEATAIHWHGMELDSYYDGVHGWGGAGGRVTPLIEPGQSFTVRFTPPRAGTFIYHTHLHDDRQLTSGMYGALLVLEPGETFDPTFDHVFVIGRAGIGRDAPAVLNGDREPQFIWQAGARHRIRLINITPGDILVASLATAEGPVNWRPLTKDGAPVPPGRGAPAPATLTIAVGETFDFEYQAPVGRQRLWMNVRTPAGRWQVQGRVVIK
jgi:manganese oxidase